MASRQFRAVTFDFWNTLYSGDDGAMDLVRPRRVAALRELVAAGAEDPGPEAASEAYRAGFQEYLQAWDKGVHFGAREYIAFVLRHFETSAPREAVEKAITTVEELGGQAPLKLLPGAKEAIPALAAAGYGLGLISDTSLTPGRVLVRFLEADGLLRHFSALTFSDITGYTKPDPRMFVQTLETLGSEPSTAAHVGDTPATDIAGAKALGMLAIRCAGVADYTDPPEADHVIRDLREIEPLLK